MSRSQQTSSKKKSKEGSTLNEQQLPAKMPKPMALPHIEQQIKGASKALDSSRNHRRILQGYENYMQSRVQYLLRQKKRTNQGIEQKRRQLQSVVEMKRRQEQERLKKERLNSYRENQMHRLRNQSLMHRLSHQMNYNDSMGQLNTERQRRYSSTKEQSNEALQYKAIQQNHELLKKRSTKLLIDESIERGRQRVEEFKRRQNSSYLREYNARIRQQNTRSRQALERVKLLEQEEQELLSHIQHSQQLEDVVGSKLKFAAEADLEDLEKEILGGKRTRRSESSRSHRSAFSSGSANGKPKLYSIESKFEIYSSKRNLYGDQRVGQSAQNSSRKSLSKQLSSKSINRKGSVVL